MGKTSIFVHHHRLGTYRLTEWFMSFVTEEIASQPTCWRHVPTLATAHAHRLPRPGERVAVIGCGTSWFIAQAYARLREDGGHGETDAFAASEMAEERRYDQILAITRSGTTTEVLTVLERQRSWVPTTAITADPNAPVASTADEIVVMDFADERSVVQTRFATTALALLRAHLGTDMSAVYADAELALADPLPPDLVAAEQFTFLGSGWSCGLAHEAALKLREAAGAWTEAYPAMEYRHGPIAVAGPRRVTWMLGQEPYGLAEEVTAAGGRFVRGDLDPMAELVRAQRLAVALAASRGLDPDHPRHLTRSVILDTER